MKHSRSEKKTWVLWAKSSWPEESLVPSNMSSPCGILSQRQRARRQSNTAIFSHSSRKAGNLDFYIKHPDFKIWATNSNFFEALGYANKICPFEMYFKQTSLKPLRFQDQWAHFVSPFRRVLRVFGEPSICRAYSLDILIHNTVI